MIQDLFRCYVNGTETIMTRPEYEAQRALEARRGRPYAVKLGEKCGVRYDNEPEPAAPSSAPTQTVKPATISSPPTGDAISQERPAQAPAQNSQERPTAPGSAPTGDEQHKRRRRPRPRRKPAEQAQNAPQNATGE